MVVVSRCPLMLNSQGRLDVGLVLSCAISYQALMVAGLSGNQGVIDAYCCRKTGEVLTLIHRLLLDSSQQAWKKD